MGKTSRPLKIVVHPALWERSWVQELKGKGHLVVRMEHYDDETVNLVLGPNCHYFNEAWGERELELSLKWARKEARGKK